MFLIIFLKSRHIEAVGIEDRAVDIGNGDDLASHAVQFVRRDRAHVAEALNRDGDVFRIFAVRVEGFHDGQHDAAPGGFATPGDAAQDHRLAGHVAALRGGVAHRMADGVLDVSHVGLVGTHVGRRNIDQRMDMVMGVARKTADHRLFVELGKRGRIADDSALAAAERDADQGAFPGHFHGKRGDVVQRDVRSHADAALAGADRAAVLDDVRLDDVDPAVAQKGRQLDLRPFRGMPQNVEQFLVILLLQQRGRVVEVFDRIVQHVLRTHHISPLCLRLNQLPVYSIQDSRSISSGASFRTLRLFVPASAIRS